MSLEETRDHRSDAGHTANSMAITNNSLQLEGTSSAGSTDDLNSGSHNQDFSSELIAVPAQVEDTTVAELGEALINRQLSTMSPANPNGTLGQQENIMAKDAKEQLHTTQRLGQSLSGSNNDAAVTSMSSLASSSKSQQQPFEKQYEVDPVASSSKGKGHSRTKATDPSSAFAPAASFAWPRNPFQHPTNLDPVASSSKGKGHCRTEAIDSNSASAPTASYVSPYSPLIDPTNLDSVPSSSKGKGKAKDITETPQDPFKDRDDAYQTPVPPKRKGHTRTKAIDVDLISSQEQRSESSTKPVRQPRYLDPTIASSSKNKGRAESLQNPFLNPNEAGPTPKHKGRTRTKAVDWNLVRGEPHLSAGRGRRPNASSLAPLPRPPREGQVIYIPLPGQREEEMIREGRMARPEPEVVEIRVGEHETMESIMADIRNGELKV